MGHPVIDVFLNMRNKKKKKNGSSKIQILVGHVNIVSSINETKLLCHRILIRMRFSMISFFEYWGYNKNYDNGEFSRAHVLNHCMALFESHRH